MIFLSKRDNAEGQSSNIEACVSILGFILAIGLFGGLSTLIYGLVRGNLSGTIGGGIVLGISALLSVILVLFFVYCLKNNNVNSNLDEQRSSTNHRQHQHNHHQKQNRQIRTEHTSSHEITTISGVHKYDNHPPQPREQQELNEYDRKRFPPPIQNNGLLDSTNSGYGKQLPQSPSKTSSFVLLNQSNNSISHQSPNNSNTKQNNYNRH